MICDKCGFEHNSRSVCPKCGERVVYVNEDYLKRRQEWEEAQKKGQKDALPPGIMHSTLEERKAAKKHANMHTDNSTDTQKGGPETVSLSFRVKEALNPREIIKKIKGLFKLIAGKTITLKDKIVAAYKRRFVKRRGADNPVIRELKFDDRPDTLDESNLVVSHKVFKDYRKYIFIGVGAFFSIIVVIIIVVNIVKNIDRRDVMYFDGKYAYLVSDSDKSLWGNLSGDIKIVHCDDNQCIAYNNENIYTYKDKETYIIKADNPEIITFSDEFDTIIYKSNGEFFLHNNNESTRIELPAGAEFTNAVTVSSKGKFFALTICTNISGENYYTLYLGDKKGQLEVISEGDRELEFLSLSDNGELIYLEMDTAEFGIVNSRNIMSYDGSLQCIAEDVDAYKLSQNEVYYINNEKLYFGSEKNFIDDEVTDFVNNVMSEEDVLYWKNGVCYEINNLEPTAICNMTDSNYLLVYESDKNFYAYYDRTDFYIDIQGEMTEFKLQGDDIIIFENSIYILDKNNELFKISEKAKETKIETVYNDVTDITKVDGAESIAFLSDESVYVLDDDNVIKILDAKLLTNVIFARKKYYLSDENSILWEVNHKKKDKKSFGNIENYILVE